jgi:hypothetical protein
MRPTTHIRQPSKHFAAMQDDANDSIWSRHRAAIATCNRFRKAIALEKPLQRCKFQNAMAQETDPQNACKEEQLLVPASFKVSARTFTLYSVKSEQ